MSIQFLVFIGLTALIGLATWWYCRDVRHVSDQNKDYFLAGNSLSWIFVAGSITLTNLSTDQLTGMNGAQMALVAWWEFAAVFGLIILCFVFIPIYYKYECTTTTELLEKRYSDKHIRAAISVLFLLGNLLIFLPAVLYTGSLFMKTMFGVETPLIFIAALFAIVGAAYAVFGGLRAVAVSDTFSGVLLLSMALFVVWACLKAIDFDFSGIPAERLTMIGDNNSDIPWHTLLTGMIFIQIFYWSTNQTITQRAMASPSVKEAQKGVMAAALIRLIIVPAIIVIPGIVAFKLYGDIPKDGAYGTIVAHVLPGWMQGAFAAAIAAAVLTTFNSILNSSTALYVCDIHETCVNKTPNVKRLSLFVTIAMVATALLIVPIYMRSEGIIDTLQRLYGLLSMPILSSFIVGLLFKNVKPMAMIIALVLGVLLYAFFTFVWAPFHYIHMMAITLIVCVSTALIINYVLFGQKAIWDAGTVFGKE